MMKMFIIAIASIACLSCGQSVESTGKLVVQEVTETIAIPQVVLVDRIEEVKSRLGYADAFDGATDHVVSKCLSCQLQMSGNADYAVHVEEYSVNLCSDACRKAFVEDPTTLALAIVDASAADPSEESATLTQ